MYPTYKDGQVIFAKKFNSINKGDIVIARNDLGEIIIKRVKYVPGDYYYHYLTRMQDGTSEIYFLDNSYKLISTFKDNNKDVLLIENKVPLKQYFLMGDNVDNSDDSRRFGSLNLSDILYKVVK